jgi:hypothetical protein
MAGTFSRIEEPRRLTYDACSWTEGSRDDSAIDHTNDVLLSSIGGVTTVVHDVAVTRIGPKAKMASFGMKMGYRAQLRNLERTLSGTT